MPFYSPLFLYGPLFDTWNKAQPDVNIHVKFVFSQVVMCTDMRAHHNLDNTIFNGKVDQNIEMTIGNTSNKRIRWARIQKGWLIKTLAAKVGIDAVHLSQLEGKTTGKAAMKTLRKLATKLEQPVWF